MHSLAQMMLCRKEELDTAPGRECSNLTLSNIYALLILVLVQSLFQVGAASGLL